MSEQVDEKRVGSRARVLKRGIVAFNARHSTIECTVRNISKVGCQIRSETYQSIPDTFELLVELDGLWFPCEVVWRRKDTLGICFTDEPTAAKKTRTQSVMSSTLAPSVRSIRRA